MRPPLPALVLVLALSTALAGCLGERTSPVEVAAYLPLVDAAPGRTTQFALHLESTDSFKQTLPLGVDGLPREWEMHAESSEVTLAGRATRALVVNLTPDAQARYGPHTLRVKLGETAAEVIVNVRDAGAQPAPGAGVVLEFVAFAENGTLLASNVPRLRNQSDIPTGPADLHDVAPLLPEGANLSEPLRVHLAAGDAHAEARAALEAAGYAAAPQAWADALLAGPPGADGGARAGDTIALRAPLAATGADAPSYVGFLLRVVEVTAPSDA